jgi:imidazole glycerol-phosphate synthase subunit HisH
MLVIVDYGVGNLGSLLNMCKHIGISASVSRKGQDILDATHIIVPGVGSFDYGIERLKESALIEVLNEAVCVRKKPTLGICLGMQLMTNYSEEGTESGLGWVDASTRKFPVKSDFKVPHMGWNRLVEVQSSALLKDSLERSRYYFAHSYYVDCNDRVDVVAQANHGFDFDVIFQKENIIGVQFHPEKSHKFGMKLLKNFFSL